MSDEQLALALRLYKRYVSGGYQGFTLDYNDFLFLSTFGEMDECLELFAELNIFYAE